MATSVGNVATTAGTKFRSLLGVGFGGEHANDGAVKTISAMRIMFGAAFLFDGILKWVLFEQGTMQGVVQGFGVDYLSNNWVLVGALVGAGETAAGLGLVLGIFQRPSALVGAAIMTSIWAYGGYNGVYVSGTWSFAGYTDLGGELMLALAFVGLLFAPTAYGLAARFHLRERLAGGSLGRTVLRLLVA